MLQSEECAFEWLETCFGGKSQVRIASAGRNLRMSKSLKRIFREHTGNISDKWSVYMDEYQKLFSDIRKRPISMLEIGVQNGGSLEVWGRFFPNAEVIVGCDIDDKCSEICFDDSRIRLVTGDINNSATVEQIHEHSSRYDVIIDDGSHLSSDVIRTFSKLFPLLRTPGLYIIEDVHCSYWRKWEGGLGDPNSSISFFKALVDVINFEHWGLKNLDRSCVLRKFRMDEFLTDEVLAEIHSVRFVNSLCILERRKRTENELGPRLIAGTTGQVSEISHLHGARSRTPPQRMCAEEIGNHLTERISELQDLLMSKLSSASSDKAEFQSWISMLEHMLHGMFLEAKLDEKSLRQIRAHIEQVKDYAN